MKTCPRCNRDISQQRIDYVKAHYGVDVKYCDICSMELRAERAKQRAELREHLKQFPDYQNLKA